MSNQTHLAARQPASASLVSTTRTTGQMRGLLALIALAASQVATSYERSLGVPFVSAGAPRWRR